MKGRAGHHQPDWETNEGRQVKTEIRRQMKGAILVLRLLKAEISNSTSHVKEYKKLSRSDT